MHVINVRNVQQALIEGCYQMSRYGQERDSRNGKVKLLDGVTATVYQNPCERVLLDPERDANPFFHLMESLWMLAGRRDVEFVSYFNSGMAQYSDDGQVFNAAYGYRWRQHFGSDQLTSIALALRENRDCRRQVLGIWDPRQDLGADSKDLPCNLTVTFQVGRDGRLNMVVFNRSNDLIWGAYGANAVHFSILLEFMAAKIGVPVGTYTQVSANTHVYESHWDLMESLASKAPMPPTPRSCSYSRGMTSAFPLMSIQHGRWERELSVFMVDPVNTSFHDPFFESVAKPMLIAYQAFKDKTDPSRFRSARVVLHQMAVCDWKRAAIEWIDRREAKVS